MNLTELSNYYFAVSLKAGWWKFKDLSDPYVIATKFALIHSEVSEAFEGFRRDEQDSHLPHRKAVEVELADVLIRVFDLAGALQLDLESAVREKEKYNAERLDHKAASRNATNGKRF